MHKKAKANVEPVRQRTQYSCVAASLTMALKSLGIVCTEDEVGQVMGVAPMRGATWEDCIAAAQHYGCQATLVCPSTVPQIQEWTDAGDPVIIAWNPEGREWSHASLVFDVADDTLHIADPNIPDPEETVRVVHKSEFYKKWAEKWPRYLVRRPAMRIRREISPEGKQLLTNDKAFQTVQGPTMRTAPNKYRQAFFKGVSLETYEECLSGTMVTATAQEYEKILGMHVKASDAYKAFKRNSYLYKFFKEKRIPYRVFSVQDSRGLDHEIPNEVVIEHIAQTRGGERKQIEDVLRKIDFHNGDVNHFLNHLAGAIADNYAGSLRSARFEEGEDVSEAEMRKYLGEDDYAEWVKNKEIHGDKFKKASLQVRKLSEVLKRGDRSFDSILAAVLRQDVAEDIEYAIRNLRPRQVETLGYILESGVPYNVGDLMSDLGTQREVAKMLLRGISSLSGRTAKFEKGKEMSAEDVANYLRDHGAPEAADKWLAEHSKNKDKFKKKGGRNIIDIVKRLDRFGYMTEVWNDRRMGDEIWGMVEHGEERIVREMLEEADRKGLLDNVWRNLDDKITSPSLKDDVLSLARMIGTRRMASSKRARLTERLSLSTSPKVASEKISSDLLMRTFRNLELDKARKLAAILQKEDTPTTTLKKANEILDSYGVENVMDTDLNTVAMYVNAGDTHAPTLFYDTRDSGYYLADWGSWTQNFENNGGKIRIASDWADLETELEWTE